MILANKLLGGSLQYSPVLAYQGSAAFTAGNTVFTYASAPIGTAATNRLVVVVVAYRCNDFTKILSTVTIGGISAVKQATSGGGDPVSIWSAIVPTGTTASVVATFATAVNTGVAISVYTIQGGASSTARTWGGITNNSTSDTVGFALTINKSDAVIVGAVSDQQASGVTLTNVTEDIEYTPAQLSGGTRGTYAAGSALFTSAPGALAFNATFTSISRSAIAIAAFNK